jgi:hypothetical protein
MIVNQITGEIIEPKNAAEAKEMWKAASELEKEGKSTKNSLKPYVTKLLDDNSGQPIVFDDGTRFVKVDSQLFSIPPESVYNEVGDVDMFISCLKPDAVDTERLRALYEEKQINMATYKRIKSHEVPSRSLSYVKLEKNIFDRREKT